MTIESTDTARTGPSGGSGREPGSLATFPGSAVVQLVSGDPLAPDALVAELHGATVAVTDHRISAIEGDFDWSWLVEDVVSVVHGALNPWTIFVVAGISDFGVTVPADRVAEFRGLIADYASIEVRHQQTVPPLGPVCACSRRSQTPRRPPVRTSLIRSARHLRRCLRLWKQQPTSRRKACWWRSQPAIGRPTRRQDWFLYSTALSPLLQRRPKRAGRTVSEFDHGVAATT